MRKLNYELMVLASETPNLYLCDLSSIQNLVGKSNFSKPQFILTLRWF